ncbi:MAG: tRNA (adenosine(37)-N6)-threonylcarbamoyltransferase complex dimerization subunit type 1 TsaB [Oligoflexia bacterium]|jgi:tRNA threonylcarbamoyladenosine biosynthesis protein TsaB
MHRILAWDTSGRTGVLCAFEWDPRGGQLEIHHQELLEMDQRQHSEGLFVGLEAALKHAAWQWSDLTEIGVGIGPGSFTGVRVGLTAARTFGQMLGIGLVPVSSLAVRARAFFKARSDSGHAGQQAVCTEACMGEVYLRVESAQGVQESVQHISGLGALGGFESSGLWLSSAKMAEFRPKGWKWVELDSGAASFPAALAHEVASVTLQAGGRSALEVHPAYLRAPDAQLKLEARRAAIR